MKLVLALSVCMFVGSVAPMQREFSPAAVMHAMKHDVEAGKEPCWPAQAAAQMSFPAVYFHSRSIVKKWVSQGFPEAGRRCSEQALLSYFVMLIYDVYRATFVSPNHIQLFIKNYHKLRLEVAAFWFGDVDMETNVYSEAFDGDEDLFESCDARMKQAFDLVMSVRGQNVDQDDFVLWPMMCIPEFNIPSGMITWRNQFLGQPYQEQLAAWSGRHKLLVDFLWSLLHNATLKTFLYLEQECMTERMLYEFLEIARGEKDLDSKQFSMPRDDEHVAGGRGSDGSLRRQQVEAFSKAEHEREAQFNAQAKARQPAEQGANVTDSVVGFFSSLFSKRG